jgi:hypothetical protein
LHEESLAALLRQLLGCFSSPTDYVVQGRPPPEPADVLLYERERTILWGLLAIVPELVMEVMTEVFAEVSADFDADKFMAIVWAAGCIAVAAAEIPESLPFAAAVYETFHGADISVTACFVFLATHYLRVHKIATEMAVTIAELAVEALKDNRVAHMCVRFLLEAAIHLPEAVVPVLNPEVILMAPTTQLSPDNFTSLTKLFTRQAFEPGAVQILPSWTTRQKVSSTCW